MLNFLHMTLQKTGVEAEQIKAARSQYHTTNEKWLHVDTRLGAAN
jgi:hypothetical protein